MYRWNAQLGIVNDSKIKLYSGKKKVWNWVLWSLLVILMLVGLYYTNFIILQLASTLSFFLIWFIAITAYYLVPSKRRKTFRDYNTLQN
jgi:small-conductance mechanosensitive channel